MKFRKPSKIKDLVQYEVLRRDREIKDTRVYIPQATGDDNETERSLILHAINQQEQPVIDAMGKRWVRCEFCKEVKEVAEFVSFGGRGRVNLGRCQNCKER